MLAVLPADTAATVEPGLAHVWTEADVRIVGPVTAAALLDALQRAEDRLLPLVIDCENRDQAGALISALAALTARADLAVGVVIHGDAPCQVRAVVPQLARRRWWRFWTAPTVSAHAA